MLLTDKIEIFVQLFCIDRPAIVLLALTRPIVAAFWAYALFAIVLIKSIPSFICDHLRVTRLLLFLFIECPTLFRKLLFV